MKKYIWCASIAVISLFLYKTFGTDDTLTGFVTQKERVSGDEGARYMVWVKTPDAPRGVEVLENTDTWLRLKTNSADIQGLVVENTTCTFDVNGWRIRWLSMNRNILDVDCEGVVTVDPDQG